MRFVELYRVNEAFNTNNACSVWKCETFALMCIFVRCDVILFYKVT